MDKKTSPKIRIKLKSFDIKMLEVATWKLVSLLVKSWATYKGPMPLPRKKKIYTVLRPHFVYKNSREQFEKITFTKLVDVTNVWDKTVEFLQNLSIPMGVNVEVKVF